MPGPQGTLTTHKPPQLPPGTHALGGLLIVLTVRQEQNHRLVPAAKPASSRASKAPKQSLSGSWAQCGLTQLGYGNNARFTQYDLTKRLG
jgi:hypothetical protein